MEQITLFLESILMTQWAMLFSGAVLVMTLLALRKHKKHQAKQDIVVEQLQRDLRALANAAVGVGERVLRVERNQRHQQVNQVSDDKQTDSVTTNQEPAVTAPVEYYNSASQPYEQAIRMTQTGASVEDIVNVCGLSKSEAELVHMMHRLDKAS